MNSDWPGEIEAYACYQGTGNHIPLTEEGAFFVRDALGREWVCRPLSQGMPETEGAHALFDEWHRAAQPGAAEPVGEDVARMRLVGCLDRDHLVAAMSEEDPPPSRFTE